VSRDYTLPADWWYLAAPNLIKILTPVRAKPYARDVGPI
jgi:hypothetical protein